MLKNILTYFSGLTISYGARHKTKSRRCSATRVKRSLENLKRLVQYIRPEMPVGAKCGLVYIMISTLIFLLQDRDVAFDNVSKLYLQYVKVYRTLNSCYDLMVHPQKRQLLRKLLDSTIGRIIELKVRRLVIPIRLRISQNETRQYSYIAVL